VAALVVVVGYVLGQFQPGFFQAGEAAAVEQFGFEPAPERLGLGLVVAVAAPAHALRGPVLSKQVAEAGSGVVAALIGGHDQPGRWPPHGQGAAHRFADGQGLAKGATPGYDAGRVPFRRGTGFVGGAAWG
jgi:hypothetical protein